MCLKIQFNKHNFLWTYKKVLVPNRMIEGADFETKLQHQKVSMKLLTTKS